MYDNQLTGEVPAELEDTDLIYLAVSTNDGLAGPLPLELQDAVSLIRSIGAEPACVLPPTRHSRRGLRRSTRRATAGDPSVIPGSGGGGSNRSPVTVGSISDRTITAGGTSTVNASSYFRDPDGDRLTYTARSSRTGTATVGVSGSEVTITAVAQGRVTVRITATDPGGLSAEQSFTVTVGDSAACTTDLGTISEGGTVTRTGSWDDSCLNVHLPGGRWFARYYSFTLSERLPVTIDLTSPSVETRLVLLRGTGTGTDTISQALGGRTGRNSRIVRWLAAGTYTIMATTYRPGATGLFTLTLSGMIDDSAACTADLGTISDGGTVTRTGSWDDRCPNIRHSGRFARYYSFTLSERLPVTIDLTSPSVDHRFDFAARYRHRYRLYN